MTRTMIMKVSIKSIITIMNKIIIVLQFQRNYEDSAREPPISRVVV